MACFSCVQYTNSPRLLQSVATRCRMWADPPSGPLGQIVDYLDLSRVLPKLCPWRFGRRSDPSSWISPIADENFAAGQVSLPNLKAPAPQPVRGVWRGNLSRWPSNDGWRSHYLPQTVIGGQLRHHGLPFSQVGFYRGPAEEVKRADEEGTQKGKSTDDMSNCDRLWRIFVRNKANGPWRKELIREKPLQRNRSWGLIVLS